MDERIFKINIKKALEYDPLIGSAEDLSKFDKHIEKKGAKITFKADGESKREALDKKLLNGDKRVKKIEIDTDSLNKREIPVKGFTDKKGRYHKPHTRKIKVKAPGEVPQKDVPKEDIPDKKPMPMTPDNMKELKSFKDLGIAGGMHETGSYRVKFKDDTNAIYKVMKKDAVAGELSFYNISKILDWNITPETVKANFKGKGNGSSQKWIEDSVGPCHGFENIECMDVEENNLDDLAKIFIIDMITGNHDRHSGNVMISGDHCWAIDNEDWGNPDTASGYLQSLDWHIGFDDEKAYSPMLRWLNNNIGKDGLLTFREKVIIGMKSVIENKDEILGNYTKYVRFEDFLIDDSISIDEAVNNIKENLNYIKQYYMDNK